MTTLANQVEGVRTVSGSTERDLLFPSPAYGQKVYNQTTGAVEGYNGSAWVPIIEGTGGVLARYNVRNYGALGDGVTDDSAAFAAADTAAVAAGAAVYVPPGSYVLASDVTIASTIVLVTNVGLLPASTKTLTLNGEVIAPSSQVFGGSGTVKITRTLNPRIRARWFPGADIGAKINAAITALTVGSQKGPGTIVVDGNTYSFSTAIDALDARNIRITGEGGGANSVTDWGPALIWTGAAGSGSAVKAGGSTGVEWDHLNLSYSHAAYDGNLMSLSSFGRSQNTSGAHIHHCRISGTATAKLAARLIELYTTVSLTIEHTTLNYAVIGIGCSGTSSTAVNIGNGVWFDANFSDCAIKAWGSGWTLGSLVHECSPTGGVALTPLLKLAGDSSAFRLVGCWSGDGGNGGGTIIDLDTGGFGMDGIDISMLCTHGSGTFLKCSATAGKTRGVNVHGCNVASMAVGLDLGKADGISAKGNRLACTTPWTGSEPTRMDVGPNYLGTAPENSGIVVANNANIALTPPGSSQDGFGMVWITCKEDATQAVFLLNGSAGTTNELTDLTGVYSAASGTATSTNIYWDGGTSSYRLENKRGGSRTYTIRYVGR